MAARRREPHHDAHGEDHRRHGRERAEVELDCGGARQHRRQVGDEDRQRRARDRQARHAAERGEEQTLGQELREQPRTAGAERDAEREFLFTPHGAGELKIDDVRHRDEQHEQRSRREREERAAKIAGHLVLERYDRRADRRVFLRIRPLEALVIRLSSVSAAAMLMPGRMRAIIRR